MDAEKEEEFKPRPYQVDLLEQAVQQNCIIFLPTGSGKTFIAVQLIKKLNDNLQTPLSEGGKRTFFTVNTVPLVSQQCVYISRHTGLSCKGYSGEMNVDNWTNERWLTDFDNHQVFIMTAQILLDLLSHGILTFVNINLIIFDECHRAVNDHPMRQIMQLFKMVPKEEQPHILALSATLLNANIKLSKVEETIRSLEITFHAKVATVNEYSHVQNFSAKPQELCLFYEPYNIPNVATHFYNILEEAKKVLEVAVIQQEVNDSSKCFQGPSLNKKLHNILVNVQDQFEDMGIYGGYISVLLHYTLLEGLKKTKPSLNTGYVLDYLTTAMIKIRKIFSDEMSGSSELEMIKKYSSDHVHQLLGLLKRMNESYEADKRFCTIIFVQRRISVQVLYHILKNLHACSDDYKFLLPVYILGFSNNTLNHARETICISKWNNEALRNFRNGLVNCIVATDVLDEGIDIPSCTLVVRYNLPFDFRSYVQSKGRARHEASSFVLLINKLDVNYKKKLENYQEISLHLQRSLIGETNVRIVPSRDEISNELYNEDIEPYVTVNSDGITCVVTDKSAISLINRYCNSLYGSIFVKLTPTWTLYKINTPATQVYKVSLKLPILSPCKETVFGDVMPSIKSAKRSVALKVCRLLHELGELTDSLQPKDKNLILSSVDHLFPNWIEEMNAGKETNIPGTYKKKRLHRIQYPTSLYGAFPTSKNVLYLHIIIAKPMYLVPQDNRHLTFYNLLNDSAGYGILSTKNMPTLPSFPIYMNVGELDVELMSNYKKIRLNDNDIKKLKIFHSLIFGQIIPLIKVFMMFDKNNLDNCFLVVPVNKKWDIDWMVVKKYQYIERVRPSEQFHVKMSDYELALVEPSYRSSVSVYIVTQVCCDITPNSCFPTDDFYSYAHYYKEKHRLNIHDLEQPMLEVKPISTNINCIRPRGMKSGMSKRKRANVLEDFDEHLVPELCVRVNFPALYWLKATMLPSVLHRISQLLVAEDLRTKIVKEAMLGSISGVKNNWLQLEFSEAEADEPGEPLLETTYEESVDVSQPGPELNGPEVDVLDLDTNSYSWSKEQEPIDIYRNIDRIKIIDIDYYHQFMSASSQEDMELLELKCNQVVYKQTSDVVVPTIRVLTANNKFGPGSVEIMQALTSTLGHDIFNLERLETLGDSYLKFIVSLYLYNSYKMYNEGHLTSIKGKLIGNRNLYYCGYAKDIPGRMKVDDFLPKSNFIVPAYSTLRKLQTRLVDENISPNVLYELTIPVEERFSGNISKDTSKLIENKISNWYKAESPTGMEHFLGVQTVPDKAVSDCVEALIGVYLKNMGPKGATVLLQWLGVLPDNVNASQLLDNAPTNFTINEKSLNSHLRSANYIEKQLRYKFKNRAYLLQALTHPSYICNEVTECYQRLEFLGDAIIDFLITSHIYETCNNLSPGVLTDLRSALVNNITLACLTIRYGLHTGLLAMAPQLTEAIDKFLKFQEGRDYAINDELLWILLEEDECNMSEYVEVPKCLGDLFEALIGAVYLDSGGNLFETWKVIYTLMHEEINLFSKVVPKQPVRVLHETQGARPVFLSTTLIEETNTVMVPLEVVIAGKIKLFHGFGANKKQAKCAAAKQALKFLKRKFWYIFQLL